jgi:hypothetical protein
VVSESRTPSPALADMTTFSLSHALEAKQAQLDNAMRVMLRAEKEGSTQVNRLLNLAVRFEDSLAAVQAEIHRRRTPLEKLLYERGRLSGG